MNYTYNELYKRYGKVVFHYQQDGIYFWKLMNYYFGETTNHIIKEDLFELVETYLLEYQKFDIEIIYNPLALIDALWEKDILGTKIDREECEKMIEKMKCFQEYLAGEMKEKEFLEMKYEITIFLLERDATIIDSGIFGKSISHLHQARTIEKIGKLLQTYPVEFIKNIYLDTIIVAEYFYKKDVYGSIITLGGFESGGDNNLYLSRRHLVDSFDHELYHQAMQYYDDFEQWQDLRKDQDLDYVYAELNREVKGFARNYGKENLSEDQSTVAEMLFLDCSKIEKRASNDIILSKKVGLVKKAFFELSDGKINEDFWNRYRDQK